MEKFDFQNTTYFSRVQMLDGIAHKWMTGFGTRDAAGVDALLAGGLTAEAAADEAISDLHLAVGIPEQSHMGMMRYDRGDVVQAMNRFIATRPDRTIAA